MNFRPAGYSSDEDEEFDDFSFGGETESVKEKQAKIAVETYKKRLDIDNTPANRLYSALVTGNVESVKRELDSGTDINCKLSNDYTPLLLAISQANAKLVQELITRGADIKTNKDGHTTLMAACECSKNSTNLDQLMLVINQLLYHKVDVKAIDRKRRTAFMFACAQGFPEVVKTLLPLSCLDAEDNQGWNALFYAVNTNQSEVAKILIDAGININQTDIRMNDAKYYCTVNDFQDVLKFFPYEEIEITPEDLIESDFSLESLFENLKPNERPAFMNDVAIMLFGMQCQSLIPLFQKKNISLDKFLVLDDSQLYEIGVKMSFQRERILNGLYKFHRTPWKQKSLPSVAAEDAYSTYHILIAVANCVKHLTIMESTVKYLHNEFDFETLTEEDKQELSKKITNMVKKFHCIKHIVKLLHRNALKFDTEIPNQPDLITKESSKKLKKRYWYKWSILVGVTTVPILFALRK